MEFIHVPVYLENKWFAATFLEMVKCKTEMIRAQNRIHFVEYKIFHFFFLSLFVSLYVRPYAIQIDLNLS